MINLQNEPLEIDDRIFKIKEIGEAFCQKFEDLPASTKALMNYQVKNIIKDIYHLSNALESIHRIHTLAIKDHNQLNKFLSRLKALSSQIQEYEDTSLIEKEKTIFLDLFICLDLDSPDHNGSITNMALAGLQNKKIVLTTIRLIRDNSNEFNSEYLNLIEKDYHIFKKNEVILFIPKIIVADFSPYLPLDIPSPTRINFRQVFEQISV